MCQRVNMYNKYPSICRFGKSWLKILIFLIILRCHFINAVITFPQCDNMSVNTACSCNHDVSLNMEIVCPFSNREKYNENSTITIVIYKSSQVHVTCRDFADMTDVDALNTALPALPIGPNVILMAIHGCNNFDAVLRRLDIRSAKVLELGAGVDETNATLTRQQLPKELTVNNLKLTRYAKFAADLFVDWGQLKYLEIETPPRELPNTLFLPLPNLTGLILSGPITQLSMDMFTAQRSLLNTMLRVGALHNLETADFRYLPQLQSIHLPRNELAHVPANTFAPLTELLRINLCENRLRTLPATMFAQQLKLVYIDLSENQLEALPPGIFARCKGLQELRLSHNQLHSLPSDLFATLNYLKVLHLNNNQLRSLHPHAFVNNSELQFLHLQHNQIAIGEADACTIFEQQNNLNELLLHNNSLTHLCERSSMQKMGRIDFSHNRIEILEAPSLLALACSWYFVDLSHNALQSILLPASVKNSSGGGVIKTLDCASNIALSYNALHCDCRLLNFVLGKYRQFLGVRTQLNTTHLSCGSPALLRNHLVDTLDPSELLCPVIADYCPTRCHCLVRTYDATLIINCTQAQLKAVPTLPSLENIKLVAIELDITNNTVKTLPSNTTIGYALVTRIYAANNELRGIEATQLPARLTYLDVRYNRLTQLSGSFYSLLNATQTLSDLFLSHNPWTCNCSTEQLLIAVKVHHNRIRDLDVLSCADAQYGKILELAFNEICPEDLTSLFALISLLTTGFLLAIVSALYFKYSLEINVWLYAHNACLWCITEYELDKDKLFDAFISYSHKDERFVIDELLPGLEHGDIPFRICTHERNWLAGAYIPEQIIESVEQSRRTIIVLSQHFVESAWARMEFRTAHQSALNEGRTRIILIMYSELTDMDALDTELQAYLKMNTYLKWSDPGFWNKLRYAMPHKRRSVQTDDDAPRYVFSAMELKDLIRRARSTRQL